MDTFESGIKYCVLIAMLVCIYSYTLSPTKNTSRILLILIVAFVSIWSTYICSQMSFLWLVKRIRYLILHPLILIMWANLFKHNIPGLNKKKMINQGTFVYLLIIVLILIISIFKLDLGFTFSYYATLNIFGVALLAFAGLQYLNYISNSKEIIFILQNQLFFICFALLFLYLGSLPLHSLKITLLKGFPNLANIYLFITILLHYFLYIVIGLTFFIKKSNNTNAPFINPKNHNYDKAFKQKETIDL